MTMNRILFLIVAAGLLSAGPAVAGDANAMWETRVVLVEDDGTGGEPIRIELSGEQLGFDLQYLQFGESRSVVDSAGRSILITRTEKGFDFEVDGRTISMPAFGHRAELVEIVDPAEGEFDVEVMNSGTAFTTAMPANITVITPELLDANTQATIRSVLQSAGHTQEVTFIDHSTTASMYGSGPHAIKVIKKEAQVSE
jgi:hypothetical protein